jgi:excisionase family DNA binding protein
MSTHDLIEPLVTDQEAEQARLAQRCIMAALDHSRAQRIALVDERGSLTDAPVLELPPQALRFFADMLGMMAQGRSITLLPQNFELTTQEASTMLNVSRPFVIKEINAGRLRCRKVGRHRRIEFGELRRYQEEQRTQSEAAMLELAAVSQDLNLGY